jgi:Winged helix DNA-binding domain
MQTTAIPAVRLRNQKISHCDFTSPQRLVEHMGAIQAQDFPMSKWAIGLRLPKTGETSIEAALDAGELVRTHVLRPTWHIVSGRDVRWMLALTGKQIKASAASRDREMGIDAALYARVNDLIVKALEGGKHLTRAEIMEFLETQDIKTDPGRAIHFMMNAETDALVCNGQMRGKEQTYALLDEKVPPAPMLDRAEALSELAGRYFESHGPATLPDFHWWSGLSMPDARLGLESIKNGLDFFELDGKTYFFSKNDDREPLPTKEKTVFLLPAFDEYCVSYKDRTAVFAAKFHREAITINGIFKPIIVVNGHVVGVWKRTVLKNKLLIEPAFFDEKDRLDADEIATAAQHLGHFAGQPVVIKEV